MNFNQLKYIIAVDRHRNFSRAAEECEVAQSTLSREIQRLEQEFDILIFDRSRHPVAPTMKGVDLIVQAKHILEDHRKFIEIARKMANKPVGEFKLGILPTLAPYLLPLFIKRLAKNYPDLRVDIMELTSDEITQRFEDGSLDAAVAISPFSTEGFYESPLFYEDFVLYLSPEHPLSVQKEVRWSEVPLDELILHKAFKKYIFSSEESELKSKVPVLNSGNINYQSGSLETIRKIIDRSGGVTLLPQLACLYMGKRRLKMVRPIIAPDLSRTISLITPRGFEKNRITKVIKKEILAGLPSDTQFI